MLYIQTNTEYLRKKRNLSYMQLSQLSGIAHAVIFRIEKGNTSEPSITTVVKLCKAFDIEIPTFLFQDLSDNKNRNISIG